MVTIVYSNTVVLWYINKLVLFLYRFNIASDLVEQAKDAGQLGLAGLLVWMRFMATRQLIWNKNYNVKPRYALCIPHFINPTRKKNHHNEVQ